MTLDRITAEEQPFAQLVRTFRSVWCWARRLLVAAILVAGAVVLLEVVHLHRLLSGIHPWLAWSVSGGLALGALALATYAAWRWFRVPAAITPPQLPPPEQGWTPRELRRYLGFARRYLERQRRNPSLPADARDEIPKVVARILSYGHDAEPRVVVAEVESEIDRVLEPLDRKARREVWQSASQVAVLTAVNPSAMLDVLITALRNLELMARVAKIYYGRPGPLGTARIARDVLVVAATAGVVERIADSASGMAAEMMGSWTARFAGPVGQGLMNGLLTVRLGDAAVLRCRSLRSRRVGIKPWTLTMWREMARRLASMTAERVAPDLAGGFRRVAETPRDTARRKAGQATDFVRDLFRAGDRLPASSSPGEQTGGALD